MLGTKNMTWSRFHVQDTQIRLLGAGMRIKVIRYGDLSSGSCKSLVGSIILTFPRCYHFQKFLHSTQLPWQHTFSLALKAVRLLAVCAEKEYEVRNCIDLSKH